MAPARGRVGSWVGDPEQRLSTDYLNGKKKDSLLSAPSPLALESLSRAIGCLPLMHGYGTGYVVCCLSNAPKDWDRGFSTSTGQPGSQAPPAPAY